MTRFFIVVPTFDAAKYLGRCLAGLLEMQPGAFELHVRVQDGGSSDATRDVAERWRQRVAAGEVPSAARRRLTIVSGRDGGLYDAVGTAFASVEADGYDALTWLGSDDLLLPGALATVARVLERFPEVRWLSGQPQVADEDGAWYAGWDLLGFARRNIRRGLHDGRSLPFIMQEGTFWRASLYREAGGLRRDLRLAGDFDLWRRFARTDGLVTCSFPLAHFTQRAGQASSDRSRYYREVDRLLAEDCGSPTIEEELRQYDPVSRHRPVLLDRRFGEDYALREKGWFPIEPLDGFEPLQQAQPSQGLGSPFVRMRGATARARVPILEGGRPYRFALRFRNAQPDQRLTIRIGGQIVYEGAVESCDWRSGQVIAFQCTPATALPEMAIECRSGARFVSRHGLLARLNGRRRAPIAEHGGILVEDLAFCRDRPDPAALSAAATGSGARR